tara:strand:+ start:327 stop:530 length:204 start_codon:yes stop_codon:yes gene_type:complete
MITSEEQIDFFMNYYSFDIIELLNTIKKKNEPFKLLNKCSIETSSELVDLLCAHLDLKQMYLLQLKS